MKRKTLLAILLVTSFVAGTVVNSLFAQKNNLAASIHMKAELPALKLGAFSMSLSVKDLNVSKVFYEKLGFKTFGGAMEQNYLIMKNGNALIGLFQGMFVGNMLTFNPGWDENAKNVKKFDDIRKIQKHLKENGIELDMETDETGSGPGSILLKDPDGNVILLDQHR